MKLQLTLKALFLVLFGTTFASGQATRTWVSGVGDDANPCSRTSPCKTFAGAISKTAAGGEIDVLDPGNFGFLTITKSLTIDGGGGQVASVLVAGTNGIVIQAGANDVVHLLNLRIQGIRSSGNGGLNGIRFISGAELTVDSVKIYGFNQNGIDIALSNPGTVTVSDTTVQDVGGVGIRATSTHFVAVTVDRSHVSNTGMDGLEAADHSRITVRGSSVIGSTLAAVQADSPSGDSIATVDDCEVLNNGIGIQAGPGGAATYIGGSTIAYNQTAFSADGGANFSYGTNRIHSNAADGAFSLASPGLR